MPSTATDLARCADCGGLLRRAGERGTRGVCAACGSCWEQSAGRLVAVDSVACAGCSQRCVCESRPTWLAEEQRSGHVLADGAHVVVRPLLYSDRDELRSAYERLSPESRRLRFFAAPDHLLQSDLEYLTNLDYGRHYALAAFLTDEPEPNGVGVARFIRLRQHPATAEAAVTVLDEHQDRGIGTLLLARLAGEARRRGVTTFVTFVLWDNVPTVAALRQAGARVLPEEPGIARLEVDLADLEARGLLVLMRPVTEREARAGRSGP